MQQEREKIHQELYFNNAKLFVYFSEDAILNRKSDANILKRAKTSQISSNFQNHGQGKLNIKHQNFSGSRYRQPFTSHCNRQKLHQIANENHIKTKGKYTSEGRRKHSNQLIVPIKLKQNVNQDQNNLVTNKSNVSIQNPSYFNLKSIFGPHHVLYQQGTDYLINKFDKLRSFTEQNKKQFKKEQFKQQNPNNYKGIKQLHIQVSDFKRPFNVKSHNFIKQQAELCEFLNDKHSRQAYQKIVSQNMKGRRYIDQEFCYLDHNKIEGKKLNWTYVNCEPKLPIFPIAESFIESNQNLPFVKILEFLYKVDPNIFLRLCEPPIKNAFGVWLFFKGSYRLVIVDGFFATENDKNYLVGSHINYLWLPIFIKCICKVYGTYETQKLSKITYFQIYELLCGEKLKIQPVHRFKTSYKILNYCKQKLSKKQKVVYEHLNNFKILDVSDFGKEICVLNPNGTAKKKVSFEELSQGNIFTINHTKNKFYYSLVVNNQRVFKFDIWCAKKCSLKITSDGNYSECRILIYSPKDQFGKFKLRYDIDPNLANQVKLQPGTYKLFYQKQNDTMKNVFLNQQPVYKSIKVEKNTLCLITDEEIKLGQGEVLESSRKKNGILEDSSFLYYT